MKTQILTLAAVVAIALGTAKNTYASVKNNDEVSTLLTNVSKINKIEIHGNVEVYVSTGESDKVKVYNKYYAESAVVQNQNGTLRISSYGKQKLVVWVTAADLRAITAYDNAEVKSFGRIASLDLKVDLNDNALAQLNIDATNATIAINGHAKADLKGSAGECNLASDYSSTVNSTDFAAEHLVKTVKYDKASENQLVTL